MKKLVLVALVIAMPASATSLVFSPDAALLYRSQSAAPPGWKPAPLKDGGYAVCKNPGGCHAFSSDQIIANYGTVWMYAWNGQTASTATYPAGRPIAALWPQGQYQEPGVGNEGFGDEWEGVA